MTVDERRANGDPAAAAALNEEAVRRFNAGRPEESLELLRRAIETDPKLDASFYHRGRILFESGRLGEALADAERAIALGGPCAGGAHYLAGEILAKDKTTRRQAAAAFEAAAPLVPQAALAYYLAAVNHFNCGDCVEGERLARRALAVESGYPDALWLLGQSLLEQDKGDEALSTLERLYAIAPTFRGLAQEIEKIKASKSASKRAKPTRHPRLISDYRDFDAFVERYVLGDLAGIEPFLTKDSKVFTAGSCFAANIADGLKAQGIDTATVGVPEEINSTYANRYLLEWILNGPAPATEPFEAFFGEHKRREYAAALSGADVVIISLGVAPCFFDRETGQFALTFGSHFYSQQYSFRTTTVAENVENIEAIAAVLRALNPSVRIVLTVSPVPLKGTFEMKSAVLADCVSKSTLRVAAHEVTAAHGGGIIYWPSFEMVKWYGDHAGQVFGNDDDSAFHVSAELVARILRAFVRRFSV